MRKVKGTQGRYYRVTGVGFSTWRHGDFDTETRRALRGGPETRKRVRGGDEDGRKETRRGSPPDR